MRIDYALQGTRGVVQNAAPILLETRESADFRIKGLKADTRYVFAIENNHYDLDGNGVSIAKFRLRKGVLRPELYELDGNGKFVKKYVLTPVGVVSLVDQIPDTLVAYPETDDILVRLFAAESTIQTQSEEIRSLTDTVVTLLAESVKTAELMAKVKENLKEINKINEDPFGGR